MEQGERTTHELLLKCVIILTSVVPQHLPLQIAIAVNMALMALIKAGIFCTEPFRVPLAGKVQHCLFDKTGTLTTDQLIAVGVVNNTHGRSCAASSSSSALVKRKGGPTKAKGGISAKARALGLVPTPEATTDAAMVLSACHSLVIVQGQLMGDPIELSALMGVRWNYDDKTSTSRPGNWAAEGAAIAKAKLEIEALKEGLPARKEKEGKLALLQQEMAAAKRKAAASGRSIRILQRHHFASKLQRMSTVCATKGLRSSGSSDYCCLVKGSPEALQKLVLPSSLPAWYQQTYQQLAEQGMRVLALGYKWCDSEAQTWSRSKVESDLQFAGFVAFSCITRADSATVIRSLNESDHHVSMVTGDQPLTALHVARQVDICRDDAVSSGGTALLLVAGPSHIDGTINCADNARLGPRWLPATSDSDRMEPRGFKAEEIPSLSKQFHLLVTEDAIDAAAKLDGGDDSALWSHVGCIRVFARMSPQGKARLADALQSKCGQHVLMCGDGGNDVGALKQSDIGLALLSGYGNANTASLEAEGESTDLVAGSKGAGSKMSAEDELNAQQKQMLKKSKAAIKVKKAVLKKRQTSIKGKQQQFIQEEIERLNKEGKGGMGAYYSAMKTAFGRIQTEVKKEQQDISKTHGNSVFGVDSDAAAADPMAALDAMVVRPGDASAAAPFTSRAPSVRSVVTLIRQGRCTLLSALQQQQIMMLECIISAYTLSVLSLEDARASERQLMASGWLLSIASIAFSYSKPIPMMSRVRPLKSLFHPAIFISMLGQAAIHLACMVYAVRMATAEMVDEELAEVREFNRQARLGELEEPPEAADDEDWTAEFMFMWSKPFKPNLLNTVVFLVETAQMNAVLFVNYKGRPWMKGMLENHALFMSVFICVAAVAAGAWGVMPSANAMLHLAPFPSDEFRWKVMGLVATSLVGTFIWDRIATAIFAPRMFKAMFDEARKTTPGDLVPVVMSAAKVFGGLMVVSSGNPLIWIGAFWCYRRMNASKE